jgi:glycosyltransferase involved in cell wall biosynthesis
MRICLVYDCLYPYTIGGAERWLRGLGEDLARSGHEITYVTRRDWDKREEPQIDGVRVISVSPGGPLYTESGRRRIWPPIRFGLGVFWHMLRHKRDYDAVHAIAFPYFSLIGLRAAAPRLPVGVAWFEVWSRHYWRSYVGGTGGRIGNAVQKLCIRLTPKAFVFSNLHGRRLREEGLRGEVVKLSGLYAGEFHTTAGAMGEREPLVVFAGRHIREKRADAVPAAIAAARRELPRLKGLILGDGPEHSKVLAAIDSAGASDFVEAPGFVQAERVHSSLAAASCHLLPSEREGYGMVVIEAAASGTPSVVVAEEDNAAVELIEEGVNGFVTQSLEDLPRAILAVHEGGTALRESTLRWFQENAPRLSVRDSSTRIADEYAKGEQRPLGSRDI